MCMKLRVISELRGAPNQLETNAFILKRMDPSELLGRNIPTLPFIYCAENNTVYYGTENMTHYTISNHYPEEQLEPSRSVYRGETPGVIGRIAHGFMLADGPSTVIAFATLKNAEPQHVRRSVEIIAQDYQIDNDAYIVFGDDVTTVGQLISGKEVQTASAEQQERAKLQIMLHIGADFDGRRLTQGEKRAIRKKLGLTAPADPRTAWTREAQKAGIIKPGQRLWAMQSEATT